jgi:hypothetical protein
LREPTSRRSGRRSIHTGWSARRCGTRPTGSAGPTKPACRSRPTGPRVPRLPAQGLENGVGVREMAGGDAELQRLHRPSTEKWSSDNTSRRQAEASSAPHPMTSIRSASDHLKPCDGDTFGLGERWPSGCRRSLRPLGELPARVVGASCGTDPPALRRFCIESPLCPGRAAHGSGVMEIRAFAAAAVDCGG